MSRLVLLALALTSLTGLAGCPESDVRGSCEHAPSLCIEYGGAWTEAELEAARDVCAAGGTWGDRPCERDEAVGGCRFTGEREAGVVTEIDWYGPRTLRDEELRARCDRQGGDYVLPDE